MRHFIIALTFLFVTGCASVNNDGPFSKNFNWKFWQVEKSPVVKLEPVDVVDTPVAPVEGKKKHKHKKK